MSDQLENLTKSELLQRIRDERRALEKNLARLTHTQMLLPGVMGEWTVTWAGNLLRGEAPGTPEPWDVEHINAAIYAQVKDKLLGEVLEEFRESYRAAITFTENLTEAQLQTKYADTWPQGPLWLGVAANMNFHYKEHREDLEKWLLKNRRKK
jgi:hypothetical protein